MDSYNTHDHLAQHKGGSGLLVCHSPSTPTTLNILPSCLSSVAAPQGSLSGAGLGPPLLLLNAERFFRVDAVILEADGWIPAMDIRGELAAIIKAWLVRNLKSPVASIKMMKCHDLW